MVASFVVETEPDLLPQTDTALGIDLGLTHFAVLSDGRKIDAPKFLRRAEKKLKRAQQAVSRKAKGSNSRARARLKVAKAHVLPGLRLLAGRQDGLSRPPLTPRTGHRLRPASTYGATAAAV